MFDLTDKVALVTGAGRGLGKAMALGLGRAGANVVVTSRTLSACQAVADEIQRSGRQAHAVACDLGRGTEVVQLVADTYERFGRCDVLVNNAGVNLSFLPLFETSGAMFDEAFAVNVKGPTQLAQLVARRMGEGGGGSIINVITAGILPGVRGIANLGPYCASKAALHMLTRVMAEEWGPLGVRVNALAPGTFVTDMMAELESTIPGFIQHAAEQAIQKRAAYPDEIIGAVVFLASSESSYVTAQTLAVCGGVC
ncbi:MAG: family oxidoreductase [Deltaproteobacteria bacterium]|jgi:NAD(P)-dependent dehydrogenase (short-subunit alcohol dehydrogenase family)|nr:family oxidoreductase [Deltaproteobacteria bacterium]